MAKLTPEQQAALETWAADGATLNDIQQKLKSEFGVNITYLDARLLMVDLQVKIKDKPKPAPPVEAATPAAGPTTISPDGAATPGVKLTADPTPLPGAMISGKVTFSDGITAAWFLDEMGRPGLRGQEPNYQPPAADIPIFQQELDRVLLEAGF